VTLPLRSVLDFIILHYPDTAPTLTPLTTTLSTLLPRPNSNNITDCYHLPHSLSPACHHPPPSIISVPQLYMLYHPYSSTKHQTTYHHSFQKLLLPQYQHPIPSVPPAVTPSRFHHLVSVGFSPTPTLPSPVFTSPMNKSLPHYLFMLGS
jgi:hypothetical protein